MITDWVLERLLVCIPLWMSLAVHEWAHAWTANQLGDDTARQLGRMSLDPTRHLDWYGTVLLPFFGIPLGWATPVPVNPLRFRGVHVSTGLWLTAGAGPLSNVVFALVTAALYRGLGAVGLLDLAPGVEPLLSVLVPMNLGLAVFNLLPVPPLDGGRIAEAFVPYQHRARWASFSRASPFVLAIGVVSLESLGVGPISAVSRLGRALLGS